MDILTFDHVSYRYPERRLRTIDDLSFSVKEGSFHALVGTAGSGRTTIFRLINGLLPPDAGAIRIGGLEVKKGRSLCGSMQREDLLFPWLSVVDNLALPLRKDPTATEAECTAMAATTLAAAGLGGLGPKMPSDLDPVPRKKAAFLRAVLSGSNILLLDNPFADLSGDDRLAMDQWLAGEWKKLGKTILFITDSSREAVFLSEEILAIHGAPVKSLEMIPVPAAYPRDPSTLLLPEMKDVETRLACLLDATA
jgi:putative hydroxymethylpyrimidine transport system ATP-binding protein